MFFHHNRCGREKIILAILLIKLLGFDIQIDTFRVGNQGRQWLANKGAFGDKVILQLGSGFVDEHDDLVQINHNDRVLGFFKHCIAFFKQPSNFFGLKVMKLMLNIVGD